MVPKFLAEILLWRHKNLNYGHFSARDVTVFRKLYGEALVESDLFCTKKSYGFGGPITHNPTLLYEHNLQFDFHGIYRVPKKTSFCEN